MAQVLSGLEAHWPDLRWRKSGSQGPHESMTLSLDSTRARSLLGWCPAWSFDDALAATAVWYRRYLEERKVSSREQLAEYLTATSARDRRRAAN